MLDISIFVIESPVSSFRDVWAALEPFILAFARLIFSNFRIEYYYGRICFLCDMYPKIWCERIFQSDAWNCGAQIPRRGILH